MEYDDYPVKALTFGDVLYITIMCSVMALFISMFVSKILFKVALFDGDMGTFVISLQIGSAIPYVLGNFIIYKHYKSQKRKDDKLF